MTEPQDPIGTITRRTLIGAVGLAGLGGIAATGLGLTGNGTGPARIASATSTPAATVFRTTAPSASPTVDHDGHAESLVKAFPAKTQGVGLQELSSRMFDGAREFELTSDKIRWEVTPGVIVDALSYNGQVPGPIIRVTEGERVRVKVTNKTDQTTGVHWHGQRVVNKMDGVPFITQPTIKPGETFVYDFVAKPFGSHMYHSHHNATEQVGRGMLGPLLVMPKDSATDPKIRQGRALHLQRSARRSHHQREGFSGDVPVHRKAGPAHPLSLHERGRDDPPCAPSRADVRGLRTRRLPAPGSVPMRHVERGAR